MTFVVRLQKKDIVKYIENRDPDQTAGICRLQLILVSLSLYDINVLSFAELYAFEYPWQYETVLKMYATVYFRLGKRKQQQHKNIKI